MSSSAAHSKASLSPDAALLYDALLSLLESANAELRSLVASGDTVNVVEVMSEACPWREAVRPLSWDAACRAWERVAAKGRFPRGRDRKYAKELVDEITDAGRLQWREGELWPVSAAQAVMLRPPAEDAWLDMVKDKLRALETLSAGASVVAAVAAAASRVN